MAVRPRNSRRPGRLVAPLATLVMLGYFGFHAFNGQYGIRAHIVMKSKIDTLQAQVTGLTAERERLEARVALLRQGSMERDMVDEQIRRQLNYTLPDEVVFLER